MSLNSILGTATLALQAQQAAIETAANNIANANVPGYSRQVVFKHAQAAGDPWARYVGSRNH